MLKYVKKDSAAFTLIELSIVLVIIGLVIGGSLVGRDLIAAAEQRKIISQVEQYQTAVQTFRTKYNGLPGDLEAGEENGFISGGNGDGCIGLCSPALSDTVLSDFNFDVGYPEYSLFWNMLSEANLVAGRYDGSAGLVSANTIGGTIPSLATNSAIGLLAYYGTLSTNLITGTGAEQRHFLSMASNGGGVLWPDRTAYGGSGALSPVAAYGIDQKIDDGFPGSGRVMVAASADGFFDQMAIDGSVDPLGGVFSLGSVYCAYLPGAGQRWQYNLTNNLGNCWMRFELGF